MWHEARKQEKLIRGMIVDYRRRAERRKDFYEKIKADPTQFLQLHGRPCKIHLDPAVAAAGEGPAIMMQWQGDSSNLIDRFDVRAHLDFIPDTKFPDIPVEELSQEERQCNYERYRILAQNAFLGINEDKFLQQLAIEEQFGVTLEEKESQREKLNEKRGAGAAIGYNYNDPGAQPSSSYGPDIKKNEQKESDDDSDLEILDVDLSIDVNKMEPSQAHDLNAVGPLFGMAGCDLFSFLTGDADDAEHQKQLLREEKEKAMYSGRKSRRERRAHRDKKLASRVLSPPSYAAAPAPPAPRAPSASPPPPRALSPAASPRAAIQFITSFGGDDDEDKPQPRPSYSEKVKQNLKRIELYSEVTRKTKPRSETSEDNYSRPIGPRGPNSRSVSPTTLSSGSPVWSKSRSPSYRRSKSRSRSRSISRSRSRSRSRSYDSYRRSRSRSRSRSRNYRSRRSRSPANNSAKRNKSRSISFDSNERSGPSKPNLPRYYGRRKEDKSSSELSLDSDSSGSDTHKNTSTVGNKSNTNPIPLRSSGSNSKGPSRDGISLKEKLKKKMQAQLARQLRLDKRAEAARVERELRRQARRDQEMRDLAIKLRRKQREMRHKYRRSSDESDRSPSRSTSSRDSGPPGTTDKLRSRSRSKSPEKRPPVWENEPPFQPKPKPDLPYEKRRYQEPNYPENRSNCPDNSRANYHDNSRSNYPDNSRSNYPDNSRSNYPDNSRSNYPDNSRSSFQDNSRSSFPDNSRSNYPDNNRSNYPDNSRSNYPDNSRSNYSDNGRSHYSGNKSRSRSPSPKGNVPVWENQRPPPFHSDSRSRFPDQERQDYQRFEQRNYRNEYDHRPYDNRREQNRRRPYRGGYRGRGQGSWSRDQDYKTDTKVKLVDY